MPDTKVSKTVNGIKVTVDTRAFQDMRFMRLMTAMMKLEKEHEEASENGDYEAFGGKALEMMDKLDSVAELMFGDEWERVQSDLAEQNDGFISFGDWSSFISETIKACKQKNPAAHPAPERE